MNESDFNLKHQNQNTESKIVASLERISQAFRVLLWQESKEHALSPIQVQVLVFLLNHSEEKRKVSYLADEFNMTKATISETVKSLEQKNLITKEYEPHDTRSYIIHLTPKGSEIADKTSYFTRQITAPIQNLNQESKENLLQNLFDIIHYLNKNGVITIQRMCTTCTYFRPSAEGKEPVCALLEKVLYSEDLRIDCPEHQMKA
ncbi:MarR family transcriptional regulator [Chryseobacterium sp. IHB B 17019]|jgi:DNA-binding MarR family transcriptional regulator|uniref:MarR family winged helix-turn-helix transcriptional regulator n=1 Tax=Chryseobacterium sp. IHB B 17019 TaxID=1721091 RepID=UPI000721A5BD|nr:MarR family winged helix-turn-helix transcriptional regulator [Chryseobacterium sp. IHB B 17019]ALR30622.1 MarR family transcriptional regulator [Chryseobacterium sp. IHB B 17019]